MALGTIDIRQNVASISRQAKYRPEKVGQLRFAQQAYFSPVCFHDTEPSRYPTPPPVAKQNIITIATIGNPHPSFLTLLLWVLTLVSGCPASSGHPVSHLMGRPFHCQFCLAACTALSSTLRRASSGGPFLHGESLPFAVDRMFVIGAHLIFARSTPATHFKRIDGITARNWSCRESLAEEHSRGDHGASKRRSRTDSRTLPPQFDGFLMLARSVQRSMIARSRCLSSSCHFGQRVGNMVGHGRGSGFG